MKLPNFPQIEKGMNKKIVHRRILTGVTCRPLFIMIISIISHIVTNFRIPFSFTILLLIVLFSLFVTVVDVAVVVVANADVAVVVVVTEVGVKTNPEDTK